MRKEIIGKKLGMTQYIREDGVAVPVTVCELGPCVVVQKKTVKNDGYSALKVGYSDCKEKRITKPQLKELEKNGIKAKKVLQEIETFDDQLQVGSAIDCSIFEENQVVEVSGVSKGRGFAGVFKRHGFGGGKKTHGSHFHRAPGSIGACAFPGEVWKGQRLPGRHGSLSVTVKNLKIVKIIQEKNIVLISGALPGTKNSLITVSAK
jgi:large subunit ribosomal protein L3